MSHYGGKRPLSSSSRDPPTVLGLNFDDVDVSWPEQDDKDLRELLWTLNDLPDDDGESRLEDLLASLDDVKPDWNPIPPLGLDIGFKRSKSESSAAAAASSATAIGPISQKERRLEQINKARPFILEFVAAKLNELIHVFKLDEIQLPDKIEDGVTHTYGGIYRVSGSDGAGTAIYGISLFRVQFNREILKNDVFKNHRTFKDQNIAIGVANNVKLLFDDWFKENYPSKQDIFRGRVPGGEKYDVKKFIRENLDKIQDIYKTAPRMYERNKDILVFIRDKDGKMTTKTRTKYGIVKGVQFTRPGSSDFCVRIGNIQLSNRNVELSYEKMNFKDPRDCSVVAAQIFKLLEEWKHESIE